MGDPMLMMSQHDALMLSIYDDAYYDYEQVKSTPQFNKSFILCMYLYNHSPGIDKAYTHTWETMQKQL